MRIVYYSMYIYITRNIIIIYWKKRVEIKIILFQYVVHSFLNTCHDHD